MDEAERMRKLAAELARILKTPEAQARMKAAAEETRKRSEELRKACQLDERILYKRVTI